MMNTPIKKSHPSSIVTLTTFCLIWTIKLALYVDTSCRLLLDARPKIYTFYSPLVRALETPREQRTRKTDQELLEVWKTSWYNAGWDPKVITLDDAKSYRGYISYHNRLRQVKLLGKGGRGEEYNEYCFLRYLAMAQVGGGVMSDYDLFPLSDAASSPAVPEPANFTVHQKTLNKAGPVPSLCSGSAKEWERIADAILSVSEGPSESGWSDMTALMHIYHTQPGSLLLQDHVLGSHELEQMPSSHDRCRLASRKKAWGVHFSHYDVLESGNKIFDRPQMAIDFEEKWRRGCLESGMM